MQNGINDCFVCKNAYSVCKNACLWIMTLSWNYSNFAENLNTNIMNTYDFMQQMSVLSASVRRCKGSVRRPLSAMLLLFLMAMMPTLAWAADPNDDTVIIDGITYHVLRNADDWARFGELIADARGETEVNAIMDADFTVTTMVGLTEKEPFRGIFDGNGHTLDVNIYDVKDGNYFAAPFHYVNEATPYFF